MISDPLANVLRRFVRLQRSMCIAFSVAMPVYAAAVAVAQRGQTGAPHPLDVSVLAALAAAAVIVALASVVYRRWTYSDANLSRLLGRSVDVRRLAAEPRTGVVDEDLVARINALAPHERCFVALFSNLQPALVISLGLNEIVGLLGFVPAFLARDALLLVPFALAAVGLNFSMWPAPEPLYTRLQTKLLTQSAA